MTPPSETGPDVSIIVVNFQGGDTLEACLSSLFKHESLATREFWVVDNASTDGSRALIERMIPPQDRADWIASAENVGYAAGVDLALPRCRGRYIAVLNMDTVIEPGWLDPLVEHLDSHQDVAAVSPLIALADGSAINAAGQWIHRTGLGFNRALGRPLAEVGDTPFQTAGIHGAAFVIRRTLLEKIGGMDSGGFLYHEDVNLSWLLRLMGYELACVPRARVRHDYFLSMHAEKLELLERNREAMLRAYLTPKTRRKLWGWRGLTEGMLWVYAGLRGPAFLRAKHRARKWVKEQTELIERRQQLAEGLRARTDQEVLGAMTRRYPIQQLLTLAGERGAPRRPLS
ncbi:MAG: glycosyltransferase family 2 protein [Myxococcota bacterium]|nr:glycosyltransferase family 2 protein [Myxococcota bacterium]